MIDRDLKCPAAFCLSLLLAAMWIVGMTGQVRAADFAWQSDHGGKPPDFAGYFPDDPAAGKALDELLLSSKRDQTTIGKLVPAVRKGLRHTTRGKPQVIQWLAKYSMLKNGRMPDSVVELLYHASASDDQPTAQAAVFALLDGMKDPPPEPTPAIDRAVVDYIMREPLGCDVMPLSAAHPHDVARWRLQLKPYLTGDDPQARELATVLAQAWQGKLDYRDWYRAKLRTQVQARFGNLLPEIRNSLVAEDSKERLQTINLILQQQLSVVMDESWLEQWETTAMDPHWEIRAETARIVAGHYLSQDQPPKRAVDLIMQLSRDVHPYVRTSAVWYGLTVLPDKSPTVVEQLVQTVLANHEPQLFSRVAQSLEPYRDQVATLLDQYIAKSDTDARRAMAAYQDYQLLTGRAPRPAPAVRKLLADQFGAGQPTYVVVFKSSAAFKPGDGEQLIKEFQAHLPDAAKVRHYVVRQNTRGVDSEYGAWALVYSEDSRQAVTRMLSDNPRLEMLAMQPASPQLQMYVHEQAGN